MPAPQQPPVKDTDSHIESMSSPPLKSSRYNVFFTVKGNRDYALFNTFSHAILSIDKDLKDALEKSDIDSLDENMKETLSHMGVIVPHDTDERVLYKYLHDVTTYVHEDSCFVVFPTYDCNLRCPYCYEGTEKPPTSMDDAVIENTVNFIQRTTVENKSRAVAVGFYGGEPLLYPETCAAIGKGVSEWASEKNIFYYGTLTTNGTLLTERTARIVLPYIASVHITLDGGEEMHNQKRIYNNGKGSFREVMRAINIVKDTPLHLTVRIHVDLSTSPYRGLEVLEDLKSMGLQGRPNLHIYFKELEPPDACLSASPGMEYLEKKKKALHEFPKVWKEAQTRGWGPHMSVEAGSEHGILSFNVVPCDHLKRGRYVVGPEGDVYMCPMSAGYSHHSIGTLEKGGILRHTSSYFTLLTRDPLSLEGCSDCVFLPMCSGGCPISIYEKTHDYTAPYCGMSKALKIEAIKSHLLNTHPDTFSEVLL
ncbi:MAG: radical SAM protein [Theionarchaea archaeon]|nr:radical SAM protein [Theionarchaea archaeon]MBU7022455.1 radical SAM protein [Theionarchaea archaeon]